MNATFNCMVAHHTNIPTLKHKTPLEYIQIDTTAATIWLTSIYNHYSIGKVENCSNC